MQSGCAIDCKVKESRTQLEMAGLGQASPVEIVQIQMDWTDLRQFGHVPALGRVTALGNNGFIVIWTLNN